MPLQSSVRASKKPLRLDDEVRFLRSWIEKPAEADAAKDAAKDDVVDAEFTEVDDDKNNKKSA